MTLQGVPRHLCHAHLCEEPVHPSKLMCRPHWFMVPKKLQQAVLAAYRPGQEVDKKPSQAWLDAAKAAIAAVKKKEQQEPLVFQEVTTNDLAQAMRRVLSRRKS